MDTANIQRVNNALYTLHQLLPMVESIENDFKGARNWGIVDVLGGGLITDFIKHMKLEKARNKMNYMNNLLNELRQQVQNIIIPTEFNMNQNLFLTFADFYFDSGLMDIYMTVKIQQSYEQIKDLHAKLNQLDDVLTRISRS